MLSRLIDFSLRQRALVLLAVLALAGAGIEIGEQQREGLLFALRQPWMLAAAAVLCVALYVSLGAATRAARRPMITASSTSQSTLWAWGGSVKSSWGPHSAEAAFMNSTGSATWTTYRAACAWRPMPTTLIWSRSWATFDLCQASRPGNGSHQSDRYTLLY